MTYRAVGWTCGGVADSLYTAVKQLSEPKKCHQEWMMSSAQSLHGSCLRLVVYSLVVMLGMCHSFTCPPNIQVHSCTYQFYQAFPPCSTASNNAGVRGPGYESTCSDPYTQPNRYAWKHLELSIKSATYPIPDAE